METHHFEGMYQIYIPEFATTYLISEQQQQMKLISVTKKAPPFCLTAKSLATSSHASCIIGLLHVAAPSPGGFLEIFWDGGHLEDHPS